jgi:membrane associated rhomboid family serine protease
VVGTILTILLFGGGALYVMTPEERARLATPAQRRLEQVILALRGSPQSQEFNNFLRARTRYAIATPVLIALNGLVFVLTVLDGSGLGDAELLVNWGANFAPRTTNGEWWRLLTATFVHSNSLHLLVTMLSVGLLGVVLERAVGRATFVAVYFAAAVIANAIALWTMPALSVTGGSSAAVFGLYGLLLASLGWGIVNRSAARIPLDVVKRIGIAAAVFFLYNAATDDVGTTSELAGFAVGAAAGLVLARTVAHAPTAANRAAVLAAVSVAMAAVCVVPLRGVMDVRSEIEAVVAMEQRTAAEYNTAVGKLRKGSIKASALAEMIGASIVPALRAARVRLSELEGVPPEHEPLVSAAGEYLHLREQSWRRRAKALVESDIGLLREAEKTERAALTAMDRLQGQR